eukprot:TRINITY_DN8976_c0_g1_i1.p1 TRINITY_DN8976_c0_g1~~TRINITY_DN8976_c0_g1_i1.p1  ORF type:complete len:574 (+),score=116.86 TRINITY_DN8976_c0_g1_i1:82-1803(+)
MSPAPANAHGPGSTARAFKNQTRGVFIRKQRNSGARTSCPPLAKKDCTQEYHRRSEVIFQVSDMRRHVFNDVRLAMSNLQRTWIGGNAYGELAWPLGTASRRRFTLREVAQLFCEAFKRQMKMRRSAAAWMGGRSRAADEEKAREREAIIARLKRMELKKRKEQEEEEAAKQFEELKRLVWSKRQCMKSSAQMKMQLSKILGKLDPDKCQDSINDLKDMLLRLQQLLDTFEFGEDEEEEQAGRMEAELEQICRSQGFQHLLPAGEAEENCRCPEDSRSSFGSSSASSLSSFAASVSDLSEGRSGAVLEDLEETDTKSEESDATALDAGIERFETEPEIEPPNAACAQSRRRSVIQDSSTMDVDFSSTMDLLDASAEPELTRPSPIVTKEQLRSRLFETGWRYAGSFTDEISIEMDLQEYRRSLGIVPEPRKSRRKIGTDPISSVKGDSSCIPGDSSSRVTDFQGWKKNLLERVSVLACPDRSLSSLLHAKATKNIPFEPKACKRARAHSLLLPHRLSGAVSSSQPASSNSTSSSCCGRSHPRPFTPQYHAPGWTTWSRMIAEEEPRFLPFEAW